jgi:hypothetical protein
MALVIKATDANENPGTSVGASTERRGLGGHAIHGVSNFWFQSVLVDLELSAYETGGIPLIGTPNLVGMTRVYDMYVMGSKDPYGVNDAAPPAGITFTLDNSDVTNPLLKMDLVGGEVANAATQAAGVDVWIILGGLR